MRLSPTLTPGFPGGPGARRGFLHRLAGFSLVAAAAPVRLLAGTREEHPIDPARFRTW